MGWIIALIITAALAITGKFGWSKLEAEHREARGLPLDGVDFSKLRDGTYHGSYAGGMYKWRTNACDVTVSNNRVSAIQMAICEDPGKENADPIMLYQRVVNAQSLQVDAISGATLTSKAYLKAVENALLQAQA